jgi:hypothetical protein
MGEAARLRQERRLTPPPVGKQQHVEQRTVWLGTGGILAVVAVVVVVLLATRTSPKVAAAGPVTAADRNAPASLVQAANDVGFHPTTEPGVGQLDGRLFAGPQTLEPGSAALNQVRAGS